MTIIHSIALVMLALSNGADTSKISEAKRDDQGLLIHTVDSPYQDQPTLLRVLLPERLEKDRRYSVLYVLPVEAGTESKYGDGLLEVKKLDVHNRLGLICVQPTFARLPWYADHATDARVRQESYFVKVVLPAIESRYPVRAEPNGRLLLGFSKSGWGAFTLLLRHPDLFGRAAAWDAPLNQDAPTRFGMGDIFATQENFENYRVNVLVEKQAARLGKEKRLILMSYGGFRQHHQALHERLLRLEIPHEYQDGPERKHSWDSGWIADAVKFLTAPNKSAE